MHYRQFLQPKNCCVSYVLGCPQARVAAVIDLVDRVEPFLQNTEEVGCRITHVIET